MFQKVDGVHKVHFIDKHDQINGVEVFFAAKAPGQIGFSINCRVRFIASGTKKAKDTFGRPGRNLQHLFDQNGNRDFIAQTVKFLIGKTPRGHDLLVSSSLVLKLTQFFMLIT